MLSHVGLSVEAQFVNYPIAPDCIRERLERIYIGRRFKNDTERLEKLFDLYTKMTSKADTNRTTKKSKKGAATA